MPVLKSSGGILADDRIRELYGVVPGSMDKTKMR
jgi:hypothetical protein